MVKIVKIFLASSSELRGDRDEFENYIHKKNKILIHKGIFLSLQRWEDHLDSISRTRLQAEYNKTINDCHMFVMLFFTKVGKYTEEEFDVAYKKFQETGKSKIYTYFKNASINTGDIKENDISSIFRFKSKINDIGHFYTEYSNFAELGLHFSGQLDKLMVETDFFNQIEISNISTTPIPNKILNDTSKFGIHHAYSCNRGPQFGTFTEYINKQEKQRNIEEPSTEGEQPSKPANKTHFFYLHGSRPQAHQGLFNRFVARLEGIDLENLNKKVNINQNAFPFKITFPGVTNLESLKIELPRKLMAAFQMDEEEMKNVSQQNLASILDKSSKLNQLKASDQVCVLIIIPQRSWNQLLTPQITSWFIKEFCCYQETKTDLSNSGPSNSDDFSILANTQKRLSNGPDFYFFFAITYKTENAVIREEIDSVFGVETTQQAHPVLKELIPVRYEDIEFWFEENASFWNDDMDTADKVKEKFFDEDSTPMDMKDVQKKLKNIIKELNQSEKDENRDS